MTVAVIADSAASLPPEVAAQWAIRVVPLQVIVDGVAHAEGESIAPEEVLAHLVAGAAMSTSQPSPMAFERALAEARAAGATAAVIVTLAGTLSGTAQVARAVAASSTMPVEVIDTRTVAMGAGYCAIAAAKAATAGGTLAEVAHAARATAARARTYFTVDTLEHLRRGGRIGPAVAAAGRVLGIRPVLEVVDGEVRLVTRVRTTARARATVLELVAQAAAGLAHPDVAVLGVGARDAVDDAVAALEERVPRAAPILRADVGAVLAVHTGPGTLAAVVAEAPAAD